jgi:hypothetical protein
VRDPDIVGVFHGLLSPIRSEQSGRGRCTRLHLYPVQGGYLR